MNSVNSTSPETRIIKVMQECKLMSFWLTSSHRESEMGKRMTEKGVKLSWLKKCVQNTFWKNYQGHPIHFVHKQNQRLISLVTKHPGGYSTKQARKIQDYLKSKFTRKDFFSPLSSRNCLLNSTRHNYKKRSNN